MYSFYFASHLHHTITKLSVVKMVLTLVKSNRGKEQLVYKGHVFSVNKVSAGKTIWKCIEYGTNKCKGRCHTVEGSVVLHSDVHNHAPKPEVVDAKIIVESLKQLARSTSETPHNLVAQASTNISLDLAGHLPPVPLLKRTIQRSRQAADFPIPLPTSLGVLVIPEIFTKTSRGEDFLLFDSGPAVDRILVFSTRRNLELMRGCSNWYADGTFKTTPQLFTQV